MAGMVEFKNSFLDKGIDEIESCHAKLKNGKLEEIMKI